jgi:hypothetical protein
VASGSLAGCWLASRQAARLVLAQGTGTGWHTPALGGTRSGSGSASASGIGAGSGWHAPVLAARCWCMLAGRWSLARGSSSIPHSSTDPFLTRQHFSHLPTTKPAEGEDITMPVSRRIRPFRAETGWAEREERQVHGEVVLSGTRPYRDGAYGVVDGKTSRTRSVSCWTDREDGATRGDLRGMHDGASDSDSDSALTHRSKSPPPSSDSSRSAESSSSTRARPPASSPSSPRSSTTTGWVGAKRRPTKRSRLTCRL